MKKSFEFSYCLSEVEEITDVENITEKEGEKIVVDLITKGKISEGERTKGYVSFDDSVQPIMYKVDYQYCTMVGEDWLDDQWEEEVLEVQL
jgi:hypothetical protein